MKISIEVPPEMEKLLMEKCSKSGVSPAEFIYHLLDWYFFKRKRKERKSELAIELEQLLKFAKEASMERVKYCKFSDGVHCGKELLESDIFSEDRSEPISPYRCLFCPHFIDRREEEEVKKVKMMRLNGSISELQLHDLARIAAKYVIEMYADKLVKALQTKIEEEDIEDEIEITSERITQILDL